MRKTGNLRKCLSGFLAAVTVLSTAFSPMAAYAAETEEEKKPPLYEEVKELLDAEEVVTAKDIEIEAGSDFDVDCDFTGLEIPDNLKVKVTFKEAKNQAEEDFSTAKADTFKAVYYVEPMNTEHPEYQISRNLVVMESAAAEETGSGIEANALILEANEEAGVNTGAAGNEAVSTGTASIAALDNTEVSGAEEGSNVGETADGGTVGTEETPAPETLPDSETEAPQESLPESETPVQTETEGEAATETTSTDSEGATEAAPVTEGEATSATEPVTETEAERGMESGTETETAAEAESEVEIEDGPEVETEAETETETESESETEEDGTYKVEITKGSEYNVTLNHEDGSYEPGETVQFTTDLPANSLTAVGALKVEANQVEDTADLLYSEVSYDSAANTFSFEMPEDDIALAVSEDYAEAGIMAMAASDGELWDDATEIEANTYYYYSDGTLHPFSGTAMGSGGNDSYKYIRYKVNGKTYTVNAYCMQHSMTAPPSGTTYKNMVELDEGGDDKYLRKALFYGYGGPGWGGTFNGYNIKSIMESYGCGSETRAMQHYLVDYLYDGESGFGGSLSDNAKSMLKAIKAALAKMPDPTSMELTPGLSVTASGTQTGTFKWKANEAFTITIHLEDGVSLVNETTGKTGTGNVTVKGGESFHLAATTSDVSKLKGSYEISSNYPLDFHAMLLKLANSQDIGFGYYTGGNLTLTVEWPDEASVSITKKDASTGEKLSGAVYGIYSDKACTKLIAQMPATDANGASTVSFVKTQDTVYLKEISAPTGYTVNATASNVKLVVAGTAKQEVTDKEQLAQITVYKTGEVLTGASVTESGVTFQYTSQKLKGAKYSVYAAEDIKMPGGKLVYSKGALVTDKLVTDDSGKAVLSGLHLGSYTVTETGAPENYINTGESQTVKLTYAGQEVETVFSDVTFHNDRQKAKVSVVKTDAETGNALSGGIYGLYADSDIRDASGNVLVTAGTLIEKVTTGADGTAVYTADLPIGYSYSIKEEQAPELYLRNADDVYTFTFSYTNEKEASVSFSHTFSNNRVTAEISIEKQDAETGAAQGDATLQGAVYGLYARKDITHPDGKTGVLYAAGTKVAELTTDAEGKASITGLYLGDYYVKEITPSVGYLLDGTEYDLACNYEGDQTATVKREAICRETVIKQPFQVIKAADNGKTDADLLSGAGFSAYLVSSLKMNEDGSYDFSSAQPVVITADGGTEMFTDEKGHAVSIALPYGKYVVRETTTPHNYDPVDDFTVTISENHPDTPQTWRVLLDDEFEAKLKIVKKDSETKQSVLIAGTEFKIYDMDHQKYVEQVTTYPTTVTHKSYFTDSQGYLILPENLPIGHYRVEEVTAPEGYTLGAQAVEITVDSNTAYQIDSESGDAIIEADYENQPVKGKLTVYKKGEMLTGFQKNFIYEERYLSGAEFEIYAAEDIYTPDFQKDAEGNRKVVYSAGTLVTTVTTGADGKAVAENLPLGTYRVVEKTAPDGFVRNTEGQEVTLSYADQNTPVVEAELTFGNERQKVSITAEKQDAENNSSVAGAVFGIYNANDIANADGETVVAADTLLQEMTSGGDGLAFCTLDLPLGQYYVKELKAPDGYVSSEEVLNFDASYQGQDVQTVELKAVKKNEPTAVEITKSDITTGVELDGASLKVLDVKGNVIDEWTSVKGEPHVIKRLVVGETYTLREELAPYGYLKATDVKFTIEDTAEIQPVEMKDEVPTGLLIINKKGEFLSKVTPLDSAKGTVEHLFEYVTGNLTEVTFEVYAAEDIKAADGVSEDYYKADDIVGTVTTDDSGIAKLGGLPAGKYYVKEKETAHGYVLDGETRYVDLSYRDQDTPVITYDEDWQNARQKVAVTVLKKEKDTERALAGGVFGLYTKEEIKNAAGEVLMKADTLIEQKATDANGQLTFTADLPMDGTYYVKEIQAPDGFVTTEEKQEFTFEYAGAYQEVADYIFMFENESTTVELTKTDLTTGKELPGAHLKVTASDGNVVDEWTSTEKPHVIKELVVGKTYKMAETKPADGYVTAESIEFTVENTTEVQKHEMKDDVTKVQISKTDITGSQEVPGAKITILDENDQVVEGWTSGETPHSMEKLPIGKYTLREEQAPKGYVLTEDVSFEVTDIGEIQTAAMKDDTAKGKVILNKTDKDSGEPLKGVEFELRDSNGKVLETLKTDAAGHAESGLVEIAAYKNGSFDSELTYFLVETKAADGYKLDGTSYVVTFSYVDDSTPVIEKTFDLTNEKTPVTTNTPGTGTTTTNAPKTGDTTNLLLPVAMLAASGCMIAGLVMARRRKKH